MKKSMFILSGISLLVMASCGGNKTEETKSTTDTTSAPAQVDTGAVTADELTKFKFDFAVANIPSPAQIINDMASFDVAFNPAFLNDISKVNTYNTDFSKAINLGVYNLDMAYAVANDKGADVMKYMKTTLSEIEALGMK